MNEETAEPGFIDSKCPHCGADISFPETQIGSAQDCPICMQTIVVPERGSEVARTLPLPIQAPHLLLRRFEPDDWKDALEFMSDESLFEFIDWPPLDEDEITKWLERDRTRRLTDEERSLFLAIELTSTHKVIGYASIFFQDETRLQGGFSIIIHRSYQHRGHGTEAARAVMNFWFRGLNLHRVWVHCYSRDTFGCHMLAKAGMRREGEFIQNRFANGGWRDTRLLRVIARRVRFVTTHCCSFTSTMRAEAAFFCKTDA